MTRDQTPDVFEQVLLDTIGRIERFGYTAAVIGTGECSVPGCNCSAEPYPYSYSLGFCDFDHPEVVSFGLTLQNVNELMNPVFEAVRAGAPLEVGQEHRHHLPCGAVISLVPVPDLWVRRDPGRIGGWLQLFGPALPEFVQICWADRDGNLPWEPDCDPAVAAAQPLLADDPLRYPKPPRNQGRHRR